MESNSALTFSVQHLNSVVLQVRNILLDGPLNCCTCLTINNWLCSMS